MFVIVVINGGWVVVVVVVVGFRHLVAFFVDYELSYIYNKTLVNGKNYKEKNKHSFRLIFVIWTSVVVDSCIRVVVVDAC